jgi:hypothetical protein
MDMWWAMLISEQQLHDKISLGHRKQLHDPI